MIPVTNIYSMFNIFRYPSCSFSIKKTILLCFISISASLSVSSMTARLLTDIPLQRNVKPFLFNFGISLRLDRQIQNLYRIVRDVWISSISFVLYAHGLAEVPCVIHPGHRLAWSSHDIFLPVFWYPVLYRFVYTEVWPMPFRYVSRHLIHLSFDDEVTKDLNPLQVVAIVKYQRSSDLRFRLFTNFKCAPQ